MRDRDFIPTLLTQWRVRRGLSQRDLARLAGLSHNYPGMLERGEHDPTDLSVAKLAAGLGCTVDDLSRPRAETRSRAA